MTKKEKLRNYILFNHPEWYAMRLWFSTLVNRHKFTRPNHKEDFVLSNTVLAGPFKGMKYSIEAVWSEKHPKLLGTYEKEIYPVIERVFDYNYDQLINIGSAEGFYAIGLARKINFERIITVDPLSDSFEQLKKLSSENDVEDTHHLKWMSVNKLNRILDNKHTLLVIDCEGGEAGYLNSDLVKNLKFADVIVEVHDFLIEGLSKTIKLSNSQTHTVKIIRQEKRTLDDLPESLKAQQKNSDSLLKMMDEKRPKNLCWLYMESAFLHQNK